MKFLSQVFVPTGSKRLNELIGFLCFVCASLLVLSLASYSPLDPSLNTSARPVTPRDVHNWIGVAGAATADILLQLLGVSAFLVPVFIFMFGVRWFRSLKIESAVAKTVGCVMLMLFLGAVLALLPWSLRLRGAVPAAGIFGRILGDLLLHYLNTAGAYIVALAALAVGLYLTTAFSFGALKLWLETRFAFLFALRERYLDWQERRARKKEQRLLERKRIEQQKAEEFAKQEKEKAAQRSAVIAALEPPLRGVVQEAPVPGVPVSDPQYVDLSPKAAATKTGIERMLEQDGGVATALEEAPAPPVGTRADETRRARTTMPRSQGGYKLPPSSLLHRPDARNEFDTQELHDLAQVLTQKCAEFDVRGTVVQINPGPVVTTFEFKPEAGIKYSRIVNLQDDLCLALRAESILIERMAGKSTVGIQVPNEKRETIWLREVVESEEFIKSPSKLTLSLGKDINGRINITELNSMPHLLIAGSTGSGKSVAINAFIMSILYKATPDQVRLILVDPKRVELGNYAEVPHLLVPIISEPKQAANILRNAVREMERRLKLLAQKGVRNIDQYNKLFEGGTTPSLFEEGEEEKPLPYIVIIVDELADLMMVDGANVEESITRLAQMARAIGIHLVLATQRPSVDVITGLIKANFPARMSFRVATKIDSRTILDANGAEHLLGKGDMLYLPSGSARVHRMHAPFVTEKEIAATVEFWKKQSTAEYEEGYLAAPAGEGNGARDENGELSEDDNDPLYNDAVRLVLEFGKASTSLIQRRLRVGYGRAAHLIDLMERDGIVGPADGPKPREILKKPDWLDEIGPRDDE
ncbi:MAG TPA: DNA translocase FtsK [candidate division Zixibacteria bacterium]|nr:DNA translocase FtsK [candidate division Zixibacteria bacterium]